MVLVALVGEAHGSHGTYHHGVESKTSDVMSDRVGFFYGVSASERSRSDAPASPEAGNAEGVCKGLAD